MGAGIIVSDTAPEITNRYTWLKINADGSREYYESTDAGWQLVKTEPAPALLDHTHTEFAAVDHKHSDVSVKFKTDEGVMIFEDGILVKVDN
jgi:hypothetical protein